MLFVIEVSADDIRCVVRVICGDLPSLHALKRQTEGSLVLWLQIIPRVYIPIIVVQTGRSLHGRAVELMHDGIIPKAGIYGVSMLETESSGQSRA